MNDSEIKQKIQTYLNGKAEYVDIVFAAFQRAQALPDGAETSFAQLLDEPNRPQPYDMGQMFAMIPALVNICTDNWIQLESSEHWGQTLGLPQNIPQRKWAIDSAQFQGKLPLCPACSGHLGFLTPRATMLVCTDCENIYRNQAGQISQVKEGDPEIQQLKAMHYY